MKRLRNVRHEIFAQEIANKKTQVEAYQKAFPEASYETAKVNGCELVDKPKIADRITQILNDSGLTITNLINSPLKELIQGEKEILGSKNKIITVKDNTAKAEGLKIALKLHKVLDNNEINQDNRQVNITLNDNASLDRIESIINKIKDLKNNKDNISNGEI